LHQLPEYEPFRISEDIVALILLQSSSVLILLADVTAQISIIAKAAKEASKKLIKKIN
jgi:hypothetical protein